MQSTTSGHQFVTQKHAEVGRHQLIDARAILVPLADEQILHLSTRVSAVYCSNHPPLLTITYFFSQRVRGQPSGLVHFFRKKPGLAAPRAPRVRPGAEKRRRPPVKPTRRFRGTAPNPSPLFSQPRPRPCFARRVWRNEPISARAPAHARSDAEMCVPTRARKSEARGLILSGFTNGESV